MKSIVILGIIASVIGMVLVFGHVYGEDNQIPIWIKSIAGWWSEGKISDDEYLNATQFLVQSGIIKIPKIVDLQNQISSLQLQLDDDDKEIAALKNQLATVPSSTSNSSQNTINSSSTIDLTSEKGLATAWSEGQITDSQFIAGIQKLVDVGVIPPFNGISSQYNPNQPVPNWIKNTARWWSQGIVSDSDFMKGVQYLFQSGYLRNPPTYQIPAPISTNSTSNSGSSTIDLATESALTHAWVYNKISDSQYIKGLQKLVDTGVIIPYNPTLPCGYSNSTTIPSVVKTEAGFYDTGDISVDDYNKIVGLLVRCGFLHNK